MAPGLATRLAGVLARQKIAGELVTSVIGEYMKANVTSSTQKVSFFIGHSPSMELATPNRTCSLWRKDIPVQPTNCAVVCVCVIDVARKSSRQQHEN